MRNSGLPQNFRYVLITRHFKSFSKIRVYTYSVVFCIFCETLYKCFLSPYMKSVIHIKQLWTEFQKSNLQLNLLVISAQNYLMFQNELFFFFFFQRAYVQHTGWVCCEGYFVFIHKLAGNHNLFKGKRRLIVCVILSKSVSIVRGECIDLKNPQK